MKKYIFISFLMISLNVFGEILNLKAEYEIPVTDPADFTLNKFIINDYQIDVQSATDATLAFTFPEDMLGTTNQTVVFKTVSVLEDNTKNLSGNSGTAICKGPWGKAQCTFVLKNIGIDTENLRTLLKDKLTPDELERQINLITEFSVDPIGISKIIIE